MTSENSKPRAAEPVPGAASSWPEPGATVQTTGLDFQGPELSPAPVPPLASPEFNIWGFLEFQDPIDDPAMLAFQVAQLTVGMGELLRRLEHLEGRNSDDERSA
jgi:hypothetical protein